MNEFDLNILGYIGSGFLGVSLLPQVYKTYSTKNAENLSILYIILQLITNVIFIIYGIYLNAVPIILCNGLVLSCSSLLFASKFIFKTQTSGDYTTITTV